MGWTTTFREPGMSDRAFFEREFTAFGSGRREILACATVRNVFYAAVRENGPIPEGGGKLGEVWALVVLMQRTRGVMNFGYKDMSESMGPVEAKAPASVLDQLTPTTNEYALEWRRRCREAIAYRAALPKVKRGDTVTFARPLTFGNGATVSTFTFLERTTFRAEEGNAFVCRIPKWRDRAHTVTQAAR